MAFAAAAGREAWTSGRADDLDDLRDVLRRQEPVDVARQGVGDGSLEPLDRHVAGALAGAGGDPPGDLLMSMLRRGGERRWRRAARPAAAAGRAAARAGGLGLRRAGARSRPAGGCRCSSSIPRTTIGSTSPRRWRALEERAPDRGRLAPRPGLLWTMAGMLDLLALVNETLEDCVRHGSPRRARAGSRRRPRCASA